MSEQDGADDLKATYEGLEYRLTSMVVESQRLADAALVRAREAFTDAVALAHAQAGIVEDVHELRLGITRHLRFSSEHLE